MLPGEKAPISSDILDSARVLAGDSRLRRGFFPGENGARLSRNAGPSRLHPVREETRAGAVCPPGRIDLKRVLASGGYLFLVGAVPLVGESPASSASGQSRFPERDAFLLAVSTLRPTEALRTGMRKGKRVSARVIGPGDLVSVLGEAKGWGRLSGEGPASRRHLLVRGWYLERW